MDIQAMKIELIQWITMLDDKNLIQQIKSIKDHEIVKNKRQFGSGKHLISKIADDFNETPDHLVII
jgi:hypothetical protein